MKDIAHIELQNTLQLPGEVRAYFATEPDVAVREYKQKYKRNPAMVYYIRYEGRVDTFIEEE